ncbi:MAG: glycosyltransferase family 4 protein [Pseudomonadota bacterium]
MRLLHLHSSFDAGGKELRSARLMNRFGGGIEHSVVSTQPGALGAAAALAQDLRVEFPASFPALAGRRTPARLQTLARAMLGHDLVLTYNWGAMDAVMAHTLFSKALRLPPLVHHEDGFNADEASGLMRGRNWYRRIALGRAAALIVPSRQLERIAFDAWAQPRWRVRRIANGVDTAAYARPAKPTSLPRVIKRNGEFWVGTLTALRPVKNLPRLVRAFAALPDNWQLVIAGEGPERDAIRDCALSLDIGHRVHLPGFIARPAEVVGLFDVLALSSDSEQQPVCVIEAMAAGLPVAAPAVGDIAEMVAPANARFIVPPADETALGAALQALAADPGLRRTVGQANRARAAAEFDEGTMVAAYRQAYADALGLGSFP